MNEVSRRDALKVVTTGAAVAAAGVFGARATAQTEDGRRPMPPTEAALSAARDAARRIGSPPATPEANPAREAFVLECRSWDRRVYLYVDERLKGFVAVDERAFAIAAACAAAGKPVAVKYWGHEPAWADAGRFEGVLLAMDRRDLAGESGEPSVV